MVRLQYGVGGMLKCLIIINYILIIFNLHVLMKYWKNDILKNCLSILSIIVGLLVLYTIS